MSNSRRRFERSARCCARPLLLALALCLLTFLLARGPLGLAFSLALFAGLFAFRALAFTVAAGLFAFAAIVIVSRSGRRARKKAYASRTCNEHREDHKELERVTPPTSKQACRCVVAVFPRMPAHLSPRTCPAYDRLQKTVPRA